MVDSTGGAMQDEQGISPAALFNEQASVRDLYVVPFVPDGPISMRLICLTCSRLLGWRHRSLLPLRFESVAIYYIGLRRNANCATIRRARGERLPVRRRPRRWHAR